MFILRIVLLCHMFLQVHVWKNKHYSMYTISAIYECMCEMNDVFVLKAYDWPWNLIEACKPKWSLGNGRYAQIGAMEPLETRLKNIAQMFCIIKRWAWFSTSPVLVCLFGAAPWIIRRTSHIPTLGIVHKLQSILDSMSIWVAVFWIAGTLARTEKKLMMCVMMS